MVEYINKYTYLLNVIFCAGSDDPEDVDRGIYLLTVEKNISEEEMTEIFKKVNSLLDEFNDDDEAADFPVSYEDGLNIDTLMEGIEIYTKNIVY
jgi:hypothetical protein